MLKAVKQLHGVKNAPLRCAIQALLRLAIRGV